MNIISTDTTQQAIIEQVLVMGDLAKLTPDQRNLYYKAVCESLGLNPLTRPFEYITLNGRLTLYARKDCTDQLRKIHGVSIRIVDRTSVDGVMIITAQATDKSGRVDESTGAVSVSNLRGEALANATMKAETKAKRRVTLSICGLGFTDESEIDGIPNARVGEPQTHPVARLTAAPPPSPHPQAEPAQVDQNAAPKPANGDSGFTVIDIKAISEHKGKQGSVWKVDTAAGDSFACADPVLVSDLSDAMSGDRPVAVEWQQRGKNRLILSCEVVAE